MLQQVHRDLGPQECQLPEVDNEILSRPARVNNQEIKLKEPKSDEK